MLMWLLVGPFHEPLGHNRLIIAQPSQPDRLTPMSNPSPSVPAVIPAYWQWFNASRYGLFIHWGPYALYGRGEQVLMRELRNQSEYATRACAWNPARFDARAWAEAAVRGGFRYAVLTTRHHDGYCLWNTGTTDYSAAAQAPRRDFVREYVDAFRAAGLRVGLYYSWNDFRIPAVFDGPERDPAGWAKFQAYVHAQLRELLTHYGRIDVLWFDGVWPRTAHEWGSAEVVRMARELQPNILINNRLGYVGIDNTKPGAEHLEAGTNEGADGDFGTPEHHITPLPGRLWESCQVSTWRLWCHSFGERWRPADLWLDMLTEAATKGGNLLLNVGPTADGELPPEFIERSDLIGEWLSVHGEAIWNSEPVDVGETVLFGRQCRRGRTLYLIIRFWPGETLRFQGLASAITQATLLTTGTTLQVERDDRGIVLHGLPATSPTPLFPVIKLELAEEPRAWPTYQPNLWHGDPRRLTAWASKRGTSVWVDGHER